MGSSAVKGFGSFVLPVLLVPVLVPVSIGLSAQSAGAAVRRCGGYVTSEIVSAKTEFEAKRRALAEWVAKAEKAGEAHVTWRLAGDRLLKCARNRDHFECVAIGRPCTIVQNPNNMQPERGEGI